MLFGIYLFFTSQNGIYLFGIPAFLYDNRYVNGTCESSSFEIKSNTCVFFKDWQSLFLRSSKAACRQFIWKVKENVSTTLIRPKIDVAILFTCFLFLTIAYLQMVVIAFFYFLSQSCWKLKSFFKKWLWKLFHHEKCIIL